MNLQRLNDYFEYPPTACAHAWIVENKCAWCGTAIAPKPRERIKYDPLWFDEDIDYHDINCPKCATSTRSRFCSSLGCDDGYHDDYEDDPLWFDEGDYSKCGECHGTGIERWCPSCGWQWRGEKLSE